MDYVFKRVGRLGVFLCAFACVTLSGGWDAHASPLSERLVGEGLGQLKTGDVLGAAKLFNRTAKADPKDGNAAFYLGVALNRAGQHGLALATFQRVWNLGLSHPELGFEGGWAALARRQFKTAVTLLEPYVKDNPTNAKAWEFLGRAYIGAGTLDQADAALNKALSLDPKLKPTVLLALATVAEARGDLRKANDLLNDTVREGPESPLGLALRNAVPRPRGTKAARAPALVRIARPVGR